MTDATQEYGTRWRLAAAVLVPALTAAAGITAAVTTGTFAASFVVQSGTVQLTTSGLQGNDLGITVLTVRTADGLHHTVRIGVGSGRVNGLCIAQRVDVVGAPFTLIISGGDNDPSTFETRADGLVLDVTDAQGVIGASGELQVNKNGADVGLGSSHVPLDGSADRFGLQAGSADLRDIRATVRDISVPNLLAVPDFRVQVVPGTVSCPPTRP